MSISAFRSTEYVMVKSTSTSRFIHPETRDNFQSLVSRHYVQTVNRIAKTKSQIDHPLLLCFLYLSYHSFSYAYSQWTLFYLVPHPHYYHGKYNVESMCMHWWFVAGNSSLSSMNNLWVINSRIFRTCFVLTRSFQEKILIFGMFDVISLYT